MSFLTTTLHFLTTGYFAPNPWEFPRSSRYPYVSWRNLPCSPESGIFSDSPSIFMWAFPSTCWIRENVLGFSHDFPQLSIEISFCAQPHFSRILRIRENCMSWVVWNPKSPESSGQKEAPGNYLQTFAPLAVGIPQFCPQIPLRSRRLKKIRSSEKTLIWEKTPSRV